MNNRLVKHSPVSYISGVDQAVYAYEELSRMFSLDPSGRYRGSEGAQNMVNDMGKDYNDNGRLDIEVITVGTATGGRTTIEYAPPMPKTTATQQTVGDSTHNISTTTAPWGTVTITNVEKNK